MVLATCNQLYTFYVLPAILDQGDIMVTSRPMSIPQGLTEACLVLEAVDDNIAEDTEFITVSVETLNGLDEAVQNTSTVSILDDDGKW